MFFKPLHVMERIVGKTISYRKVHPTPEGLLALYKLSDSNHPKEDQIPNRQDNHQALDKFYDNLAITKLPAAKNKQTPVIPQETLLQEPDRREQDCISASLSLPQHLDDEELKKRPPS